MWSPESKKIAFENPLSHEVDIINDDGSSQIKIDNAMLPSWSPDGIRIAFVSSSINEPEIYVVSANGGDKIRLAAGSSPSWSPDGTKIAFSSQRVGADKMGITEIYIIHADGNTEPRLIYSKRYLDPWSINISWSPDSSKIMFSYVEYSEDPSGFGIVDIDADNQTLIASGGSPAWSPDGTKIALEDQGIIYVTNADGSNKTRLVNGQKPIWSPDGKQIAYELQDEIYTIHSDGSNQRELATGQAPAWSPR